MASTLDKVPAGQRARVIKIEAGPGMKVRLLNMGIVEGTVVKVLSNGFGHVVITSEFEERVIALSYGMAKKILVEVI